EPLFRALVREVQAADGQVAGLGARDTLRTEMGYPLHGHELSTEISPVQARAGWAVGWKKPELWGKAAVEQEKAAGPTRILWALKALGRGVLRQGQRGMLGDQVVGETASGAFSPSLKVGIALALLDTEAALEPGAEVAVDVRGRRLRCEVVRPPFVEVKAN